MEKTFSKKLKRKLNAGKIVSVANNPVKKNSKWKKVDVSQVINRSFPTLGIMSFEELDPSEYFGTNNESSDAQPKRKRAESVTETPDEVDDIDEETTVIQAPPKPKRKTKKQKQRKALPEVDTSSIKLPEWEGLLLNPLLLKAIEEANFKEPTPIQLASIPHALHRKDIVGAAATGSGKTLAFGLPILHKILEKTIDSSEYNGISALIISPTRELAMQIVDHLKRVAKYTNVNIVGIVGGLATVKQERALSGYPDIVVATPGRLWELMETATPDSYLYDLSTIQFLVIDEADRMVETGHFKELEYILQSINTFRDLKELKNKSEEDIIAESVHQENKKIFKQHPEEEDEDDEDNEENIPALYDDPEIEDYEEQMTEEQRRQIYEEPEVEEEEEEEAPKEIKKRKGHQTFVFSATLTTKHIKIITKKKRVGARTAKTRQEKEVSALDKLFETINFTNKVEVIDLTSKETVNSSITQAKVICTDEDKDLYLYAFITEHPGRTLLFVNAIATTKRLIPLFKLLQVPIYCLHAEMQQKQRLKSLERFKSNENAVLVATDVAARGLDIASVSHVIHYHIPSTFETYVHRSGRTARAGKEGVALMFVNAQDAQKYKKMCQAMKCDDLPDFPFNESLMPSIKQRMALARNVENLMHKVEKERADKSWMQKAAEDLDIILDTKTDEDADWKKKQARLKIESLTAQLNALLKTTLVPKGTAKKYAQMTNTLATFVNPQKNAIQQIQQQKNKKPKKLKFKPK